MSLAILSAQDMFLKLNQWLIFFLFWMLNRNLRNFFSILLFCFQARKQKTLVNFFSQPHFIRIGNQKSYFIFTFLSLAFDVQRVFKKQQKVLKEIRGFVVLFYDTRLMGNFFPGLVHRFSLLLRETFFKVGEIISFDKFLHLFFFKIRTCWNWP